MSDFNPGDKVKRVDLLPEGADDGYGYAYQLPVDQVFEVKGIAPDGHVLLVGREAVAGVEQHFYPEHLEAIETADPDDDVTLVIHPDMLDEGEVIIVDGVRRRVSTEPIPSQATDHEWWDAPVPGALSFLANTSPTVADCRKWASQLGLELRVQVRQKQAQS